MNTRNECGQEQSRNLLRQAQARAHQIAKLNDAFRRTGQGGRVMMTSGIAALPDAQRSEVLQAVRDFSDFNPNNDPYGEHDFAFLTAAGQQVIFKIDCYDQELLMASSDAADPTVTTRVLMIMLSAEY